MRGKYSGRLKSKHKQEIYAICWSPDESRIASGSNDKRVLIWNAMTGEVIQELPTFQLQILSISLNLFFDKMVVFEATRSIHLFEKMQDHFQQTKTICKMKMKNANDPQNTNIHLFIPESHSDS